MTLISSSSSFIPGDDTDADSTSPEEKAEGQLDSVLLVRVGETWLGLDSQAVEEVIAIETPSPLPFAPPHLLGVIIHGERVLPLVHLGRLLSLPAPPDEDGRDQSFGRTIVLKAQGMSAGVLCDRAAGVVEVPGGRPEPLTLMKGQRLAAFLLGELDTPRGRCGVVDVDALFDAARVKE